MYGNYEFIFSSFHLLCCPCFSGYNPKTLFFLTHPLQYKTCCSTWPTYSTYRNLCIDSSTSSYFISFVSTFSVCNRFFCYSLFVLCLFPFQLFPMAFFITCLTSALCELYCCICFNRLYKLQSQFNLSCFF